MFLSGPSAAVKPRSDPKPAVHGDAHVSPARVTATVRVQAGTPVVGWYGVTVASVSAKAERDDGVGRELGEESDGAFRVLGADGDGARHRRVEFLATVLLAVAAVATAWSTYQSVRWRGEQAENSSLATAAHIESAEASTRAGQLAQIDVNAFSQWIDADLGGDDELARFYRERFRDEFQPAFDAWMATNPRTDPSAPNTPFEMPDYGLAEAERARELNVVAGRRARTAEEAIQRSDYYMLAVVLFASALFFAGISAKFGSPRAREVLIGVGAVSFLVAAVWVTTLLIIDSF
jgi:hypothetical protein